MVEMAIVLPVLMLLVAGLVNFAVILGHWQDGKEKAHAAARYAAVGRTPDGGSLETFMTEGEAGVSACVEATNGMTVGEPVLTQVERVEDLLPILDLGATITVTA